jgi:acetylornithine deacetylase/succinyl-diaminopimelate desuccinylase-like protein
MDATARSGPVGAATETADLERLVRVPSVSAPGGDPNAVRTSAELVAQLLAGCGLDTQIIDAGGRPAVLGRRAGLPNAPRVLLYAHHDVTPPGDLGLWRTEPFEPVEHDGRLYGRGTADDAAGIMMHVAALRALGADLRAGVTVLVEGEEEYATGATDALVERHQADLAADLIIVADSGNWDVGRPALTTSLRGGLGAVIEVRVLEQAVHSGMFGGPIIDALIALSRIIASLHDANGDVAVAGLAHATPPTVEYPADRLRAEAGMVAGVRLAGTGTLAHRLWTKPSIAVLGIDAPATGDAPSVLVPSARALIEVRLPPGQGHEAAFEALRAHVQAAAPFGAPVTVQLLGGAAGGSLAASGNHQHLVRHALRQAWDGTDPVEIGIGGSIPIVDQLHRRYPHATIAVTGAADPRSNVHGPNESLHLDDFRRACLAETLILATLSTPPATNP